MAPHPSSGDTALPNSLARAVAIVAAVGGAAWLAAALAGERAARAAGTAADGGGVAALALVAAGASLWLHADHRHLLAAGTLGAIPFLVGTGRLVQYATPLDLPGLDALSLPTAVMFGLLGASLTVLSRTGLAVSAAQILAMAAMTPAFFALLGHLYGADPEVQLPGGIFMPSPLAAVGLLLAWGIVEVRRDSGVARLATDPGPARILLRRMLPAAVLMTVAVSWLRLAGQRAGFYETEFGITIVALTQVLLIAALMWLGAASLYRADRERSQAEAALRNSEERQRAILSSIAEAVLITDPAGRVVGANRAFEALTGWPTGDALGLPFEDVVTLTDDRGHVLRPEQRFLSRAVSARQVVKTDGQDLHLQCRRGGSVPVGIIASPVVDEAGALIGGVEVIRDLTRERELDDMRTSLIATVSHELRTPLTMIKGFSELMLGRDGMDPQMRSALEQIHRSSQRLARLIGNLLSISKMDAGALELAEEELDLRTIADEVAQVFAGERDIRVRFPDAFPPAVGDRDKVEQILTNLVSNAVKYSAAGSPVVIAGRIVGSTAEVEISDEGVGMSDDEAARVFEPFFRSERPEVRSKRGTGLGLHITKRLVELHGGELRVRSTHGVGSTFTFSLPLAPVREVSV